MSKSCNCYKAAIALRALSKPFSRVFLGIFIPPALEHNQAVPSLTKALCVIVFTKLLTKN